jgi:hypothetical protein
LVTIEKETPTTRDRAGILPYACAGRVFPRHPVLDRDGRPAAAFAYSLYETFDVGCDKGSPVTDDYAPLASVTGTIVKVDFDFKPDFVHVHEKHHEAQMRAAMIKQ